MVIKFSAGDIQHAAGKVIIAGVWAGYTHV